MISIWDGGGRVARSPAYDAAVRELLGAGRLIVQFAADDATGARLALDDQGRIRRIALASPPSDD